MNLKIATLGLVLASVLPGCVPDRQSIEITGTYAPDVTESCEITPQTTGIQRLGGTLNVAYSSHYILTLVLQNNMETSAAINGNSPPITDKTANDFFLKEMEVEYTCVDTAQRCATFPRLAPQVVPMSGNLQAGAKFDLFTDIIIGEAAEKLREKLGEDPVESTLSIKFRGDFAHGVGFETASYRFPLTVYNAELASVTCDTGVATLISPYACAYLKGQDATIACVAQ